MDQLEGGIERALWSVRLVVLVPVVASLAAALAIIYMAAVDTVGLLGHATHYAQAGVTAEGQAGMRLTAVTHVVEIVDGFLLAAFLIIFGLGLYELFISKIEAAQGTAFAESILHVRSLDDLKGKLAQVVLIMLVVKFFEHSVAVKPASPYELVLAAGAVALIGLALFLGSAGKKASPGGSAH